MNTIASVLVTKILRSSSDEIDDRRDEAVLERAQALDGLALHRLGGDDLDVVAELLLEPAGVAHQRAAGPEPGDERGDLVELLEDLERGAVVVRQRVRLVAVLVGHVVRGVLLGHVERQLDGAVRALRALGVDDLGAVHAQQLRSARRVTFSGITTFIG